MPAKVVSKRYNSTQQNKTYDKENLNRSWNTFTVRVFTHWHRLPCGTAESPAMEILKTWLDTVLGNLL